MTTTIPVTYDLSPIGVDGALEAVHTRTYCSSVCREADRPRHEGPVRELDEPRDLFPDDLHCESCGTSIASDARSDSDRMIVGCACGVWSGQAPCAWTGPRHELVTVEYMPVWLRESHRAAGNRGVYPANGASRIGVSPECAALMLETDGEWCAVVDGSAP